MVRLIAICLGLIPRLGLGAITGGIVTMTFGLLGIGRAAEVSQARRKMSITGVIAGVLIVPALSVQLTIAASRTSTSSTVCPAGATRSGLRLSYSTPSERR